MFSRAFSAMSTHRCRQVSPRGPWTRPWALMSGASKLDCHLAAPQAQLAAGLDEGCDRFRLAERDHSLVGLRVAAGLAQERDRIGRKRDELAMREGVGHEIAGGRL